MHRFFVSPATLLARPVTLTGAQAHQVRRVLRLRPGDHLILLDNAGHAAEAVLIEYSEHEARLAIERTWEPAGEPGVHITLYQAVLKGEHFAYALQKGTEIGISRFVPIVCERSVVDDLDGIETHRPRWERIIQEAAEQCGRPRVPELGRPRPLPAAARDNEGGAHACRLIPWEGEQSLGLRQALARCNLKGGARIEVFVGPEGGLTADEVRLAQAHGIVPVSLGPRILRAETAGVVAATVILYEAGGLDPLPAGAQENPD